MHFGLVAYLGGCMVAGDTLSSFPFIPSKYHCTEHFTLHKRFVDRTLKFFNAFPPSSLCGQRCVMSLTN